MDKEISNVMVNNVGNTKASILDCLFKQTHNLILKYIELHYSISPENHLLVCCSAYFNHMTHKRTEHE